VTLVQKISSALLFEIIQFPAVLVGRSRNLRTT